MPEITIEEFKVLLESKTPYLLVDVREENEREIVSFKEALSIPLGEISTKYSLLNQEKPVILVCHHGVRSLRATLWLREKGIQTLSLKGGIHAWGMAQNPQWPAY